MEHPLGRALDPPSQIQLRAVLRVRRTWLAGLLAVLAIGTAFVVISRAWRRADAVEALLESTR